MLERKIVSFLCENDEKGKAVTEVYRYGAEILLNNFFTTFIIIITGVVLSRLLETLIFIFTFTLVRSQCGGYHAKNKHQCLFATMVCYFLVIAGIKLSGCINFINISAVNAFIIILFMYLKAPIKNINKPMNASQIKKHKIYSIIFTTLFLLISYWISGKIFLTVSLVLFTIEIQLIFDKRERGRMTDEEVDTQNAQAPRYRDGKEQC